MADDFFAVLGISESLSVDENELREAWHRAAQLGKDGEAINHAYAVLREPGKRIRYLLDLHGHQMSPGENPGATLFELFLKVGTVLKQADAVDAQINEASSVLQRAALTSQLLASLAELTAAKDVILAEEAARDGKLALLSQRFPHLLSEEWETLASLGKDFTFLNKWHGEVQKRKTRLQETLMGKIG